MPSVRGFSIGFSLDRPSEKPHHLIISEWIPRACFVPCVLLGLCTHTPFDYRFRLSSIDLLGFFVNAFLWPVVLRVLEDGDGNTTDV